MTKDFLEIPVKDTPKTARMIATTLIPKWSKQVASIVPFVFKKDNKKNTFENLWKYCRENYNYHEDPSGKELIRSPFQSKKDATYGIDCEDFAIIVSCVLLNLGHKPALRIVDFGNGWQHIYVMCDGIAIDPVNDTFNLQEKFVRKMDFQVGQIGMSGLPSKNEKKSTKVLWGVKKGEADYMEQIITDKEENFVNAKKWASDNGFDRFRITEISNQFPDFAETVKPISKPQSTMKSIDKEADFTKTIVEKLKRDEKLNKVSITKIANSFGITNNTEIKELTEYAIVLVCRDIVSNDYSYKDTYDDLKKFYKSQPNLSLRTSNSILLQQYSTPSPIAYLMGIYCRLFDKKVTAFEPSAGNGLLTIASTNLRNITVNEIDPQRNQNLQKQDFRKVISIDGSQDFDKNKTYGDFFQKMEFDAILTNPPFGALNGKDRATFNGFEIKVLDHLMAIRALNKMQDDGKAAIIVGGHTEWDELGRVQAGKNRIFLNYLYKHYNVDDIILINGDLYSRQGTSFDIRLILINGRKETPSGVAPLKNDNDATVENTFESLFDRVMDIIEFDKKPTVMSKEKQPQPKFKVGDYVKFIDDLPEYGDYSAKILSIEFDEKPAFKKPNGRFWYTIYFPYKYSQKGTGIFEEDNFSASNEEEYNNWTKFYKLRKQKKVIDAGSYKGMMQLLKSFEGTTQPTANIKILKLKGLAAKAKLKLALI